MVCIAKCIAPHYYAVKRCMSDCNFGTTLCNPGLYTVFKRVNLVRCLLLMLLAWHSYCADSALVLDMRVWFTAHGSLVPKECYILAGPLTPPSHFPRH